MKIALQQVHLNSFFQKIFGCLQIEPQMVRIIDSIKMVAIYKMSTSQDSKTLFKSNLTCIVLSVRAKFKRTKHNRRLPHFEKCNTLQSPGMTKRYLALETNASVNFFLNRVYLKLRVLKSQPLLENLNNFSKIGQ